MNFFTKEELAEQGYLFSVYYDLKASSGKNGWRTPFNFYGGRASPADWVENIIEKSRILGFSEIPHTIINQRETSKITFHFKSELEAVLFDVVANGLKQKKEGHSLPIIFPADKVDENVDACMEVISEACKRLGIEHRFKDVDIYRMDVLLNSNADLAALINEVPEFVKDGIQRVRLRQENLRKAGFVPDYEIKAAEQCAVAQSVITKVKQLRPA